MENQIKLACEALGWTVRDSKKVSNHPADWYLQIVLAERMSEQGPEYVTWLYNAEFDSMNSGHYFYGEYNAEQDFKNRR